MRQFLCQDERSRTADRLLRLAAAGVCMWMPAGIANAQAARSRYPLVPEEVVTAMRASQLQTRGAEVRLAAPVTAAVQDPALEIEAITPLSPRELRLRVACRNRSECLPFFAVATYTEDINPATLPLKSQRQHAESDRPAPAAGAVSEGHPASASAGTAGPGETPILHSGSPATLDFDSERVHVRIEVICLQSGGTGDRIRVATRDHKQTYVAEIVAPTLLKGTF
jgi:hypothetical protein